MGEFGGVGQQVLQNLLQAFGVPLTMAGRLRVSTRKRLPCRLARVSASAATASIKGVQIHWRGVQRIALRAPRA